MTDAQEIVSATLRMVAEWGCDLTRSDYQDIAQAVESMDADDICCPLCEEVICDDGCPLWVTRMLLDEEAG